MSSINQSNAQTSGSVAAIHYHQNAPTQFMNVQGTAYAYRILGSAPGIPLILFQHFTGTLDDWDPALTNGLAEHYTVLLFDNKGAGRSGGQTPNTISEMATDAIDFVKALGYSKVNLLGLSLGGFVTQEIILQAPELVNKLILAGTQHKGGAGLDSIIEPLTKAASLNPTEQKIYLFFSDSPRGRAAGAASQARIRQRVKDRDIATSNESVNAQLNAILEWAKPIPDAISRLQQIKLPVLIVNGDNDIVVPTANSYEMFKHLPNAYLYLYPDANHGSIFDYAELFVKQAVEFLN